ncbi:MAG: GntR family transcriptional regulator [Oscillospiraceae bacterium]|nr:GntR family transcriptional regulator [Oscillospiraceae bacterium]
MIRIDTTLISDKVVAELRRQVLYGTLKPGQEIYQEHIAEQLGVSRMPVREAFQILANDGFVTIRPNKTTVVNEVSEKFVKDFYTTRIILESSAVQMACANHPDCRKAWEAYEKGEEMIERKDMIGYNMQNALIHRFIWDAADNFKLRQILASMWHTMDAGYNPYQVARQSNDQHRELILAIETNDPQRGAHVIRQHIQNSIDGVLRVMKEQRQQKEE